MSFMSRQAVARIFSVITRKQQLNFCPMRTILSDSYRCSDAWNQRLHTPILQKVDPEEFSLKLQEKFDKEGGIASVDLDILANKLIKLPKIQMDFAQSLIYRFRHTKSAVNTSDSLHYAIIRTLLEIEEYDRLREILKDKIHYGIFLDKHSANLLMDHYIKEKMYLEAAEVAIDLMLQEDLDDPINHVLAWYSCHLLWRNPGDVFADTTETVEETIDDDEEETYIFVNYIDNPYYDDHFDIPKVSQQLGKTLTVLTGDNSNLLERSYQLIGLGLYKKFDRGITLLENWADRELEVVVTQEALDDFKGRLESATTRELSNEPKDPGTITMEDVMPVLTVADKDTLLEKFLKTSEKLAASGKVNPDFDLDSELLKVVTSTVTKFEGEDIRNQTTLFSQWNTEREELVKQQIQFYKEEALKAELEQKLEELRETEEKLTFFDNIDDIRLAARLGQKKKDIEDMFASEKLQNWAPRT